jgi:threonine/homoserine/homoserine lactone efflux protein
MNLEIWFAFVMASSVLLLIPGPTTLTVISYSLSHGRRASIALVAAVTLGDSTALLLSLMGLGTLLAQSAFWFQVVKWLGGLYLLYLGIKMISKGAVVDSPMQLNSNEDSGLRLFFNTYLVTALNPKGIVFFVAFLPQFVHPDSNAATQLWILASTFVGLALLNATLYVTASAKARDHLLTARSQRFFNLFGGSVMATAGVWALSTSKSNT